MREEPGRLGIARDIGESARHARPLFPVARQPDAVPGAQAAVGIEAQGREPALPGDDPHEVTGAGCVEGRRAPFPTDAGRRDPGCEDTWDGDASAMVHGSRSI